MGLSNPVSGLIDTKIKSALSDGPTQIDKMVIVVEKSGSSADHRFSNGERFKVMFNPASLSHGLTANWEDPVIPPPSDNARIILNQFKNWTLDTLTFDLLFDTTEPLDGGGSLDDPQDVRIYTSRITNLLRMDVDLHRPPLCQLMWGPGYPNGEVLFVGHARSITQTFNYFSPQGRPLRAKLACSFVQWLPPKPDGSREAHSTDVHKIYVVNQGDTLASIARATLHDDALWRPIAVANHITDPLDLQPGRVLMIPTLDR